MQEGAATRPGRRPANAKRSGFTLTELALSMTVMLIALMSTSAAKVRASALQRQNREQAVAVSLVRSVAERLRAESERVSQLADPNIPALSWSALLAAELQPGGALGDEFGTPLLTPQSADGQVGRIELVTSELASDADLDVAIGMPRDLDGDGLATNSDVTLNARVLPVIITVAWRSQSGDHTLRHPVLLTIR